MVTGSSEAYLAAAPLSAEDRGISLPLLRWLIIGVAALALCVLAVSHSSAVGAQSAYPPNTAVSTYFDPRYCDGLVSVVTDQYGNLIDVCTTTGQRIYPVYLDYGNGYAGAFYNAPNYVNSNVYNRYYNGFNPIYVNPNNICQSGNFSACYNGFNPNYINPNNPCPSGNFTACFGGNFSYFTNPFFFGYTGVVPTNVTVIAPGGNAIAVGPPFRPKEVGTPTVVTQSDAPAAAPAPAPVVVTTSVAAAPVAVAPAAVAAPVTAAPSGNMATALNAAPASVPEAAPAGGTGVKILSAPAASAPAAKVENGRDDRD